MPTELETIIVEGPPAQTKAEFFKVMESRVQVLSEAEFREKVGPTPSFAHFESAVSFTRKNKRVDDAEIYINKDDFMIGQENYTDLIPIAVRHEIAELWVSAKTGYSLVPLPKWLSLDRKEAIAHGIALREEFKYAFETEQADRYLDFVKRWAESRQLSPEVKARLLQDNEGAYELIKSRLEST